MSTTTKSAPEADLLKAGDTINFLETVSIQRDDLLFSEPIITRRGTELVVTEQLLKLCDYPEKESFLTRLDTPNRNGKILARKGSWPVDELRTTPGTYEHQLARDTAVKAVWDEFGPGYSDAKRDALKAVDKLYGGATDSWSFSQAAGARG